MSEPTTFRTPQYTEVPPLPESAGDQQALEWAAVLGAWAVLVNVHALYGEPTYNRIAAAYLRRWHPELTR